MEIMRQQLYELARNF